jgi:nucleoid-associated protein YgaU
MPAPDVMITPVYPATAPSIEFGLLGDAVNSVYSSGGYPWVALDRPTRKPFVEFNSTQLTQLVLPLVLDRADIGDSVEAECDLVHGWRYPVNGRREPTPLRITGPVDTAGISEWVVINIEWGAAQRRADHARIQQEVKLTTLEASFITRTFGSPAQIAQTQIQASSSAVISATPGVSALPADLLAQLAAIPAGAWRDYAVKLGETLEQIAARQLGDARWWTVIGQLNGIKDPNTVKPGSWLRLPW